MKTTRKPARILATSAAALVALCMLPSAAKAQQFWDVNGAAAGLGGTGAWNLATPNWNDITGLGVPAVWANLGTSDAAFTGVAGVVTVSVPGVVVNEMTFTTTGYTVTGASGLGLVGGAVIDSAAAVTTTISVGLTGAASLDINGNGGTGTVVFAGSNANTYTGLTTVEGGTLQLNNVGVPNTAIPAGLVIGDNIGAAGSAVVQLAQGSEINDLSAINFLSDGRLDMNGFSDTVGSISGVAGSTIHLGAGTLRAGANNTTTTYAGVIGDAGAAGNVTKQGTGTWTLTGANLYTGLTNVEGGILEVGNNAALGTTAAGTTVNAGATLRLQNGVNIGAEALTLNGVGFNPGGGPLGALAVVAGGTSTVGGAITINTNNAVITAGNGSTLNLTGGIIKNGLNVIIGNAAPGATTATSGIINITGTGISGTSGVGSFNSDVLFTAGTTNLGVASPFLGATWLNNGAVVNVNVPGALPQLAGDLGGGGIAATRTAVIMDADVLANFPLVNFPAAPAGAIGGTGGSTLNLFVNQSIQFLASGPANVTPATRPTVNLGTNILTIGTSVGTPGFVSPANFFGQINGLAGAGNVSIIKDGTSTQIFSGANTYLGLTNVTAGTLQLGNALGLGSAGLGTVVSAGATLDLGGQNVGVEAVTINGTGDATAGVNGALGNSSGTAANLAGVLTIGAGGATVGGAGNIFLDGQVTGGALTKVFADTVILTSNANNYTTTTINAGILQVGNAGSTGVLGTGLVTVTAPGQLTFNRADFLPVNNVINGNGVVNQGVVGGPATGITVLNGANGYTGITNVIVGTLRLGNVTALGGTGAGTNVLAGATLDLNGIAVGAEPVLITGTGVGANGALINSNLTPASLAGGISLAAASSVGGVGDISLDGPIVGAFGLTKVGTNTVFLTNSTNGSTTTLISAGTLQVGGAAAGGTAAGALGSGAVTNNSILTFNRNNALAVANNIGGTGVVNQIGTGVTLLGLGGGGNTYTGQTNVLAGTLQLNNATALGAVAAGTVVAAGATLDLFGQTVAGEAVSIAGTGDAGNGNIAALTNTNGIGSSLAGVVTLTGAANIGGNAGTITLSNTVTGAFPLTKVGSDLVIFSGTNNYTGITTVAAGILQASSNLALGVTDGTAATGTVVTSGATLALAGGVTITNEVLTIAGNGVAPLIGALNVLPGAPATYTGPITLNGPAGTATTFTAGAGATGTFTGGINKNAQTLVFKGTGGGTFNVTTLGISGATSFTSDFVVDGGITNFLVANAYAGPTWITNGGTLNANVLGALPSLPADGGIAAIRTTVIMDPIAVIPSSPATSFPSAAPSTLNLGANQAIQALIGTNPNPNSTVNLNANTLTIGFSGAPVAPTVTPATFAGLVIGAGNILKDGTSTQIFAGLNTYTGTTTVNGGTLQAGVSNAGGPGFTGPGAFGNNSAVTVNAGGTLDTAGFNVGIGSLAGGGAASFVQNSTATPATLTTGGDGTSTTYAGVIQNGPGAALSIFKVGGGTQTLSGPNTYGGSTTVAAGTLKAGIASVPAPVVITPFLTAPGLPVVSGAFGVNSAVIVNGGFLDLAGFNNTIGSLAGAGGAVQNSTATAATLSTGTNNTSTNYFGVVQDGPGAPLSLTKVGLGTQVLSGINTYTGATNVLAGALQAGSLQAFGVNSPVTVASVPAGPPFAILELADFSNTIGSLSDGGVFPATGIVSNAVANGPGLTVLTIAGTNPAGVGGAVSYGGTIVDTALTPLQVVKNGAGTQSLSGQNTHRGLLAPVGTVVGNLPVATVLNAGILNIDANSSAGVLLDGAPSVAPGAAPAAPGALVSGPLGTGVFVINGGEVGTGVGSTAVLGAPVNTNNAVGNAVQVNGNFSVSNIVLGPGLLPPAVNIPSPAGTPLAADGGVLNSVAYALGGAAPLTLNSDGVSFTGPVFLNQGGATFITTNSGFLNMSGVIADAFAPGGGLTFTGNSATYLGSSGLGGGVPGLVGQVDASNTYAGLTTVAGGFVFLGKNTFATAIPGNLQINPGASVIVDSFSAGTTANQIAVTSNVLVNGALDLSGINQAINNLTGSGLIELDDINGAAVGGASIFTVNSGNFSGSIFDNGAGGQLVKNSTGTLILSGFNPYVGNTTVNAGNLQVNGFIGSANTFVNLGGTLSGTGVVGGNVINGGTVSPGGVNANPGTLQANGNYTQTPAGTLLIQVAGKNAGQFDVLTVGGAANLGGTLRIVNTGNVRLKRNQKVTFLTAAAGRVGKFATENVDSFVKGGTLLKTKVLYRSNSVQLAAKLGSFENDIGGLTPNQKAVARELDLQENSGGQDNLLDFLSTEQKRDLPNDLDLIAPEELASIFNIGVSLANVQTANIQRRMSDIQSGATGFSSSGYGVDGPTYGGDPADTTGRTNYGSYGPSGKGGKELAPPSENRWGVFVNGVGEFTNIGNTTNARGYDLTTGGFTIGMDYKVTPNFAIGINTGYARTGARLNGGGRVEVDGAKLGLYATYFTGTGYYVDAAVSGGYNNYETRRGALRGTARGGTSGGEFNALLATGYDWKTGGGLTIGPVASVQYTTVSLSGFRERGSLAPLRFGSQTGESLRTALGMKASYDIQTAGGLVIRPEMRAAWQHEFGDSSFALDSRFANGAGNTFTVRGPEIGSDSLLLSGGVAVLWNERTSTYVYYDGELGRTNASSHNVSGGVRVNF